MDNPAKKASPKKISPKLVICFAREGMGDGPEDLGRILLQAFVNNLRDQEKLPATIVCYNGGAKLAATDSPVCDTLKELTGYGVEILVCGTCVNYFNLVDLLGAGRISNMHEISSRLLDATQVIYP